MRIRPCDDGRMRSEPCTTRSPMLACLFVLTNSHSHEPVGRTQYSLDTAPHARSAGRHAFRGIRRAPIIEPICSVVWYLASGLETRSSRTSKCRMMGYVRAERWEGGPCESCGKIHAIQYGTVPDLKRVTQAWHRRQGQTGLHSSKVLF